MAHAGKRLVMAASPGTGLFAQEPRAMQAPQPRHTPNASAASCAARRGGYTRQPSDCARDAGTVAKQVKLVDKEEERVNGQLVDILERKCGKLRARAEAAEDQLSTAEARVSEQDEELAELRRRLHESELHVSELCNAQREFVEGQRQAAQVDAALRGAESGRSEAERGLKDCQQQLQRQREEAARTETEWKDQIVKLVAGDQSSRRRIGELERELESLRAEKAKLTESAQDLVRRYEEESAQRLELQEKCLGLEEKFRTREERARGDLNAAHDKVKQSVAARQRAEEFAKQRDEREKQAGQRVEELELRVKGLEAEAQRLRATCAERGRRLQELSGEAQRRQEGVQMMEAANQGCTENLDAADTGGSNGALPPSRLPVPIKRRPSGSRPGTGQSVGSAASAGSATGAPPCAANPAVNLAGGSSSSSVLQSGVAGGSAADKPRASSMAPPAKRMPPGAIRRAGSTPSRGAGGGYSGQSGYSQGRGRPPSAGNRPTIAVADAPSGGARGGGAARPSSRPSSGCGSRPPSEVDDLQISDALPSEDSDSSDEEVLTAVKAAR